MTGSVGLSSLIYEDLHAVPATAVDAAETLLAHTPGDPQHQLDTCLAALAAGNPRRALAVLETSRQSPRVTAALTAWALQLDRNWYPGGVGAETMVPEDMVIVEPRPGTPTEEYLERLVAIGPLSLFTARAVLETSVRSFGAEVAQQAVGEAMSRLRPFAGWASEHGFTAMRDWTWLAAADIAHRGGMPQATELLAAVRESTTSRQDAGRLALSYIVEGDWYAAPGSSPDALGFDLAPQQDPSPLLPADLERAADCYTQALAVLGGGTLPRLRAVLSLRAAMLDRESGDDESRLVHLGEALAGYRSSGDLAGYHLAAIHQLVADIDQGLIGQHALDLGGGWHPPVRGPIAEVLSWAESVGSRSWCVGLGRLLERCANEWTARGSSPRARMAYLAAVQLIATDPAVPAHSLMTAVAQADSRNNLPTHASLRLERAFGSLIADTRNTDPALFAQKIEAGMVMVSTLDALSRGPAAAFAAARMERLRSQIDQATEVMRATVTPSDDPVPRTAEALQRVLTPGQHEGSLNAIENSLAQGEALLRRTVVTLAGELVTLINVLAPLARARMAQRAGNRSEVDRQASQAVHAAEGADVFPHLLPLALMMAGRDEEARATLASRAEDIEGGLLLPLSLRAKVYAVAEQASTRPDMVELAAADWRDLLSRAELALVQGQYSAARRIALEAISRFEDVAHLLLRDPDRLDACDQADVAALYTTLALTHLAWSPEPVEADIDASLEAAEQARSLSYDVPPDTVNGPTWRAWQHAAAQYAAIANRLVADLAAPQPSQIQEGYESLDRADGDLAAAEHAADAEDRGVLLRRATTVRPATAAQLRRAMPEGAVLFEYYAAGDDLLAWAMTKERVVPVQQRMPSRDLAELVRIYHRRCADGSAPTTKLEALLLEPFTDLLRHHSRVLVVPFGPLNLVPFHALRLDGEPLALTHVVSYLPRATSLLTAEGTPDRPATLRRPLIVGDPAFDPKARPHLQRLPGARAEAAAVAAALAASSEDVLTGSSASEEAVASRLEECDLLHISSHGHLDELSPFASSLVLAGTDELTVADIAGLRFGTDLAVLTGCDTGRGNATLGGDVVGLTRSLLRGGVDRTVVSLWPVDDMVAPVVMRHFYSAMAAGAPPASALALAQRRLYQMSADELRTAYLELSGGTDSDHRRGTELDDEYRDLEELPSPLEGDAERYWAPFVLVG